jgi:hypothetical protein
VIIRDGTWKFQGLTLKPAWSPPFSRWQPVIERELLTPLVGNRKAGAQANAHAPAVEN